MSGKAGILALYVPSAATTGSLDGPAAPAGEGADGAAAGDELVARLLVKVSVIALDVDRMLLLTPDRVAAQRGHEHQEPPSCSDC